ncbi:hypothetical protein Tco_0910698 [Tanacetum coccineum]|uniref:Uncharacterized protein n=1 Tax=Tanacetum coccineum TaxID=301880 RepID=A0ABQ5CVU8_9ASTR
MSASILIHLIYSASTTHSESTSRHDALADLTTKVDLSKFAPNDSISKKQDMDKGTQNYSLDHMFAGTNLSVFIDKTKYARDGLKTSYTKTSTNLESNKTKKENKADKDVAFGDDEFNISLDLSSSDDTKKEIKLEDLSKLVQDVGTDFIDLDLPEDDEPIIVQDESDEEVHTKKVQTKEPKETKDALASHPPSPKTIKIQELRTKLLVLQTLNSKLIREKEAAETEASSEQPNTKREARKEECIDLLGVDVVTREDSTDEVIPNFKASDLHLDRLGNKPLGEEDPLDKLNDLTRKKRKHADDIHDLFRSTKKFKSSVQYGDHPAGTVLNEPILDMILLYQGPGLDDHARTFSSLLLAEVDKRNLNPLKQMRTIEQLRQQMYGYIKNHKKTVKNGQTRTRETEEHKRSQRCKAKIGKVKKSKLWSTLGQQKSTHTRQ